MTCCLGNGTLYSNLTGSGNTAIGGQAFGSNIMANNNTAVGYKADASVAGLTNATAIGANASVSQSNTLVLGSTGVTQTEFNGALMPNNSGSYSAGNPGDVLTSQGPSNPPQWKPAGVTAAKIYHTDELPIPNTNPPSPNPMMASQVSEALNIWYGKNVGKTVISINILPATQPTSFIVLVTYSDN